MSENDLIKIREVSINYDIPSEKIFGKTHFEAVSKVDFDIKKGDSWAIVGESGSGKSTLAGALLGLLEISGGEIEYSLDNMSFKIMARRKTPRRMLLSLWKRASIVFQDPFSALDSRMLVGEIVAEPFTGHGLGNKEAARKKSEALFPTIGLKAEHIEYFPDQLSGGLRQRVAIGRALINDPQFIVFDEPTSSLDVSIQAQILNLILDIKERKNLTYIFITHNLLVARYVSEKVVVMYSGNAMEIGRTSEVFADPKHPYTKLLISLIPRPEPGSRIEEIPAIRGSVSRRELHYGCVFHDRCPVATEYCGWSPEEVVEIIETQLYSLIGSENLKTRLLDDVSFTIDEPNEKTLNIIYTIISDNRKLVKYKDIKKHVNEIKVTLHEPWKPRMVNLDDNRSVKCILYDREFPEFDKIRVK